MPPIELSRRDAMFVGGAFIGGGLLLMLKEWGVTVPDGLPNPEVNFFQPGWLETRHPDRPAFIQSQVGHAEYLRYMCLNDQLLASILHEAYGDLVNPPEERPSLADTFKKHIEYAKKWILPAGGSLDDVTHVAFFTMAAVHSSYFTNKEIRDTFRINLHSPKSEENNIFWARDYLNSMPVVFSEDHGTEDGVDKAFHFANFAFLVHQYWYAKKYGLKEAEEVPNAADFVADSGHTDQNSAVRLAKVGQNMWEFYETLSWLDMMFRQKRYIVPSAGFFDPDVKNDFRANKLGILFALRFCRTLLTEKYIRKTINRLDDPEKLLDEVT